MALNAESIPMRPRNPSPFHGVQCPKGRLAILPCGQLGLGSAKTEILADVGLDILYKGR